MYRKIKHGVGQLIFRPGRSIDADLRYLPLVKRLKGHYQNGDTVLEVGAGDYGITPYFAVPITAVDIPQAFTKNKSPLVTPVLVDGTKLPVKDSSFDYIFSVDMLEHVKAPDRIISINEMIRAGRKQVFISVPTGELSERQDAYLDEMYAKRHGEHYHFLTEHLENGLPRVEELTTLIKNNPKVQSVEVYPNANLRLRQWYMGIWMHKSRWSDALLGVLSYLTFLQPLAHRGDCYRSLFVITLNGKS